MIVFSKFLLNSLTLLLGWK